MESLNLERNLETSPAQQYELLIHSLSHGHTKMNFDRHVLLFDKWTRDYKDGYVGCLILINCF